MAIPQDSGTATASPIHSGWVMPITRTARASARLIAAKGRLNRPGCCGFGFWLTLGKWDVE